MSVSKSQPKAEKFWQTLLLSVFGFLLITITVTLYNSQGQTYASDAGEITVYKSPTCGCCKNWVNHLKENGFKVKAIDTNNLSQIKQRAGIPPAAGSCHTAFIGDYSIEGHVPASDIKKLLAEKRPVKGLTVPGMPMGSPGMEGSRVDKYAVYEFDNNGKLIEVNRY